MDHQLKPMGLHPKWWALILAATVVMFVIGSSIAFNDSLRSVIPVTLASNRAGLVMETGAKVKLRGVQVGQVSAISSSDGGRARLQLEIDRSQLQYIPANVDASIKATTAFGAKYVDLSFPEDPSPERLSAGQTLLSRNVTTEVNTVFENLMGVLDQVDPAKLNSVLTAIADAIRGKGPAIGQQITDIDNVVTTLNGRYRQHPRRPAGGCGSKRRLRQAPHRKSFASSTPLHHQLDDNRPRHRRLMRCCSTPLASRNQVKIYRPNRDNLINSINVLRPTTELLMKYNPEYTCLLLGAKWCSTTGRSAAAATATAQSSTAASAGLRPLRLSRRPSYRGCQGWPRGKAGLWISARIPPRTIRSGHWSPIPGGAPASTSGPNPGIGHPCWANYLPVTRAFQSRRAYANACQVRR